MELSFVEGPVRPYEFASAPLLAFVVVALVAGLVGPHLHPEAMLPVCLPLALVLAAVLMHQHSKSVSLIFHELSLVAGVSFIIDEPASALELVSGEPALVECAIS